MRAATALRICIVLVWAMVIIGVPISIKLESKLPIQLQIWLQDEYAREISTGEAIASIAGIVLIIVMVVASVGLFRLRRWGAWLYLGCSVAMIPFYAFLGPTVEHALVSVFDELVTIAECIMIGIAFFSDALRDV